MAKAKVKAPAKGKERKDMSYRQLRNTSLTFELKTGRDNNLIIFDEETENTRAIKHCPNEASIFVDKQSKLGVVKPIIFVNGLLHVSKNNIRTQEFLALHPGLGSTFDIVDEESNAKEMLDYEDAILDIKTAIRKKSKEEGGIEEIRVMVGALTSDVSNAAILSPSELKYMAYELAETNPNRFLNEEGEVAIFDDSSITRQAIAQQAFISGVVSLSPDAKTIVWSDNKAPICSVPTGRSHTTYFAQFLETEDGISVMKEIDKR